MVSNSTVITEPSAARLPMSIRWSILLFAFSLPFEQIELTLSGVSLARITGVLVLASCLLHHRLALSKPHVAYWLFSGYLVVHFVRGAIVDNGFFGGFFLPFLTLIQLVIVAWLLSEPLKRQEYAIQVLVTFCVANMVLTLGMIFRLPGFVETLETKGVERLTAAGSNPNMVGSLLAVAIVVVIGLILGGTTLKTRSKILLGVFGLLLPIGLLLTQSRGAIVALIVGVAFYLLPIGGARSVARTIPFVMACLVALIALIASDPDTVSRLSSTYYEGDLSGRDKIIPVALSMIAEKPLSGWGPGEFADQLGRRLNEYQPRDAHNTFLQLLLEVGFLGTVPFVLGLFFCLRRLWKFRNTDWGKMCLAAFVTLMAVNMSGTWIRFKLLWFIIAISLSIDHRTDAKASVATLPSYKLRK
ncbi:MAG: hypothetical protein C5B58_02815 [Acidobacteria bacterium]|nr:MAG: hypothetical protein C5B58_02815 [Acidobacteriota bacterium]